MQGVGGGVGDDVAGSGEGGADLGVHVGVDGVDRRVGEHGGGSRQWRQTRPTVHGHGWFRPNALPAGLVDAAVGELLGRVGHRAGWVVVGGGVGVVGVEVEMHGRVAVVVSWRQREPIR